MRLARLAISDEGFVFDPNTGESFTCNAVGLAILKELKDGAAVADIAARISDRFEVDSGEAMRDIDDFIEQLRSCRLI